MANWFCAANGVQQGPIDEAALRQLAATGGLRPTDLIWQEGMPAWQPAGQLPGLFPAGTTPPPLPPMAMPVGYAAPATFGQPQDLGENAGARWLMPVGRSGWAIAAGYLGLLSVIMIPAPFALICGIIAVRDIRRDSKKHGMGRAIFGIIMGVLFTIALGVMIVSLVSNNAVRGSRMRGY